MLRRFQALDLQGPASGQRVLPTLVAIAGLIAATVAACATEQNPTAVLPSPSPAPPSVTSPTALPASPTPLPFLPPLQYFLSPRAQVVHAEAADCDDDGVEETILLYRDGDQADSFVRGLVAEPPTPQTPTPLPTDETVVLPDVYWLGPGAAVELFQGDWERLRVEDINGDGQSELLLEGYWDEETRAVHVFQWDGSGYASLLNFQARGELTVSQNDGILAFDSVEHVFPRSSLVTYGSARWTDSRYQVQHDTTWANGAVGDGVYPEAAVVHAYEALATGDVDTVRDWWSDELRTEINAEELDERLVRLPDLRLERVQLLEEGETAATVAVTLRWTDPTSGSTMRSASEVWELLRQTEGWRLHRLNDTPRGAEWTIFTSDDGLTGDAVTDLLVDGEDRLWMACADQGLTLWDGSYWVPLRQEGGGLPSDTVRALRLDDLGRLWLATPMGITLYDGLRWVTYTTTDGLPSNDVNALATNGDDVWAGTAQGAALLHEGTWQPIALPEDVGTRSVSAVAVDAQGAVWMGLGAQKPGGTMLARLDGDDWQLFGVDDGLVGEYVGALTFAPDGTLLAALASDSGAGGGLGEWTGEEWRVQTAFDILVDVSVYDVGFAPGGGMWIATSGGAATGFGPAWLAFTTAHGLASDTVYSVLPTADGQVFLGTAGGLTRFREAVARQVIGGGQ